MNPNSNDQSANSNKQFTYLDDDTESDVEEIGPADYNTNQKGKTTNFPSGNNLYSNQNQFNPIFPTSTSNLPSFIQNDFLSNQSNTYFSSQNRFQPPPTYSDLPIRQKPISPPPPPRPQKPPTFSPPKKSNLTSQGQFNKNNFSSIPLHPSVHVPNYYTFTYHDVNVKFPYAQPYEAQKRLISSSILAFKKGENALLESPTGTGKSLALLSAALSYLETAPQIVKLYYTSRTHIQLQQLVSELKKLPYFPQFSILASKRHLCIVPQVANSISPESECRKLCEEDGCPYSNSENKQKESTTTNSSTVIDIEDLKVKKKTNPNNSVPYEFTNRGSKPKFDLNDLKDYGKRHNMCPYQLAFNIYHNAQLCFCPYNYILKPNDYKNLLLDFPKGSTIAIFDEGHNIESTARDDASLSLPYKFVEDSRRALQYVPVDDSFKNLFEQVQKIQTDILNFIENKRDEYNRNYDSMPLNNRPKYLAADNFYSVFSKTDAKLVSGIGVQMFNWLQLLSNSDKESLERDKMYVNDIIISFFSATADVFLAITTATFDFYRIVFVPDEKGELKRDEFRLLCLKPSFLFDKINRKTRSIIISSGTLSPLDSFAAELESSFPIRVSAPHVVDPSQVVTITINSYENCRITSRYSAIQTHGDEIYSALSEIILKTLKQVPGGSLFFTPSYYSKDMILREWKSSGMFNEITSIKPIVEEKSNLSAPQIIKEFVSFPEGALLIGVCRGKISEGLDFADDLSRIVYVFGIPYPGFKEADVELKMRYNDIRHSLNKLYLSGQDWYTCQAFRALFQSVGRCLRHTSDYGAIVFLDERIEANIEKLPTWLKMNIYKNQSADQAEKILASFYRAMKEKFPQGSNFAAMNSHFDERNMNFEAKNAASDFGFAKQSYSPKRFMSPKPVRMTSYSPTKSAYESRKNSPSNSPSRFNSGNKFSPSNSPSRFNSENRFSPSNSPSRFNSENKFSSPSAYYQNNSPSNSPSRFNSENRFSPSNSPSRFNSENKFSSPSSYYQSNSPSQISPEDQFSFYSKSSINTNSEPENKFTNASSLYQKVNTDNFNQPQAFDDNEFLLAKETQEKDDRNRFLTNVYCSSCGSVIIRIKNLDCADFKTIRLPEFFQILNTAESNAKIMYINKAAVQSDLTRVAESVTSDDFSITLTRRECQRCGVAVGAYVLNVEGKSEFKKGELLFRQDRVAMEFDGQILSLTEIASNS